MPSNRLSLPFWAAWFALVYRAFSTQFKVVVNETDFCFGGKLAVSFKKMYFCACNTSFILYLKFLNHLKTSQLNKSDINWSFKNTKSTLISFWNSRAEMHVSAQVKWTFKSTSQDFDPSFLMPDNCNLATPSWLSRTPNSAEPNTIKEQMPEVDGSPKWNVKKMLFMANFTSVWCCSSCSSCGKCSSSCCSYCSCCPCCPCPGNCSG